MYLAAYFEGERYGSEQSAQLYKRGFKKHPQRLVEFNHASSGYLRRKSG